MKIFKIVDEELNLFVGTLLYYEKAKDFIIELVDTLDEWTAPLLMTSLVKKGIFTVPREISALWVKERIIPSGRQNIGAILNTHKLRQYEEISFLELSAGRCSQDHMYIERLDALPEYVIKRARRNVHECVVLDSENLLCFFADNTTRKVNLNELAYVENVDKILKNTTLLQSCKVGTGGYSITFNDSIDIPSYELHEVGTAIPLTLEDFVTFMRCNALDTADSCRMLACSRQNISYIVRQRQLMPAKKDVKGNLYLRGDVIKNNW